ncbi:MAG: hypothetical protein ACKOF9_14805 [Burkholderiales bacterium]
MSRTAPPVHVLVDRFAVWTIAVVILGVIATATLLAWATPVWTTPLGLAQGLALSIAACVLCVSLWRSLRSSAVSLRWDGERWWLGQPSSVGAEPWPVHVVVCMDLGSWMLLQLRAHSDDAGLPRRHRWLPLQRQGLELQWHGLRCALYVQEPRAEVLL